MRRITFLARMRRVTFCVIGRLRRVTAVNFCTFFTCDRYFTFNGSVPFCTMISPDTASTFRARVTLQTSTTLVTATTFDTSFTFDASATFDATEAFYAALACYNTSTFNAYAVQRSLILLNIYIYVTFVTLLAFYASLTFD